MNEDDTLDEMKHLSDKLSRLQPARSDLDPRVVFYESGFAACESQFGSRKQARITPLIAACLLAVVVSSPISYYAGQVAANQTIPVDSVVVAPSGQPQIDALVKDDPAPMIATPESGIASGPVQAVPQHTSELFSRWLSPLDSLAASVKLEREASTTLTVFHSSLVSREESAWNWTDFPFPITSTPLSESPATGKAIFTQPLAVSDLHELATSLEAIR